MLWNLEACTRSDNTMRENEGKVIDSFQIGILSDLDTAATLFTIGIPTSDIPPSSSHW